MPVLTPASLDCLSHSPEQTRRLGVRLGALLHAGDVVCLSGELGSGKTCLAIGVGRGWGALEPVTSPTFVLVNEYRRADGQRLHHVDCYRIRGSAEALAFGLADLLDGPDITLIEWAERVLDCLPAERLGISFRYLDEEKRGLRLEALGPRYEALLTEFRRAAFGS